MLQSRNGLSRLPKYFVKIVKTFAYAKMTNTDNVVREWPLTRYVRKIMREVSLAFVAVMDFMLA